MAENYYACARRLAPGGTRRLVLSGGLAQKCPVLREAVLARFQADWRMAPAEEDALMGLLVLALAFTGRAASVEEATAAVKERQGSGVNV